VKCSKINVAINQIFQGTNSYLDKCQYLTISDGDTLMWVKKERKKERNPKVKVKQNVKVRRKHD
jgi:hypothetical protein